jgi:hypothetical protein
MPVPNVSVEFLVIIFREIHWYLQAVATYTKVATHKGGNLQ